MTDRLHRERAIDPGHSCIVQAPAGSGKTELLIQRLLVLLAQVERPQQVLAITFTNKAAAEMRARVLAALHSAAKDPPPGELHKRKTWQLARDVIARHGVRLIRNPGQLTIQTIDSLNAALVRRMPWISRFGQVPEIAEDPEILYRLAVERLVAAAKIAPDGSAPLQVLLRHLDNRLGDLERMLISMLSRRDQWLRVVMQTSERTQTELETALEGLCREVLVAVEAACPVALREELLDCANYAAVNRAESTQQLDRLPGSQVQDVEGWLTLADLLLTAQGELRKTVNKSHGFPAGTAGQAEKQRMLNLLNALDAHPHFIRRLGAVRKLPRPGYSHQQWHLLNSLFELLPRLVAELWLVFRAQGQVDFSEIALRALQALGSVDNPSQLLLDIDQDLKHILVDEFQDTSRLQYQLLDLLTSGWTPGDGRSLFLVGDPMQSIYRFREAEVGLFLHSFLGRSGRQELELTPLVLTANFRSQKGLVDWVNRAFKTVFPTRVDPLNGAVPLSCAEAVRTALSGEACSIYPYIERQDDLEAQQVVDIVKQAYLEDPQQSIAILVRSRNHLNEILPLLRKNEISYQAQDIDLLGAQPAALDIVHLTRALLHRADRLSWLAVLRAPWCGLMLSDLHILLTASAGKTIPPVLDRAETVEKLSSDGQLRLGRVWPLLKKAHEERGRLPLRDLVEGCWLSLGAPACYSSANLADALKVFELLEKLDEGGDLLQFERLDKGLMTLFADADSSSDGRLQIMTIHKAKGLEFDTVILPGLGKMPRRQESPLLRWLDHPQLGLLMAPVTEKGHQHKDPLYQWLSALDDEKNDYETGRLLYVATTRAIRRLHLLGHARQDSRDQIKAQNGSLLEKLWPFVADQFSQRGVKAEILRKDFQVSAQYRLAAGWARPDLNSLAATLSQVADIPSDKPLHENDPTVFSGWENPLHRQLGTVVHLQLEKIAKSGVDCWAAHNRPARIEEISRYFRSAGVSSEARDPLVSKACRALDNCLSSHRGRWILQAHPDHACEWPLTGVIDGRIVRAVIDRTFIADGVRWVIDYKTSSPQPEETLETFFSREIEHYKKQLAVYVQLLEQADEAVAVRAALYFPLIDGWCEL